MDYSQKYDGLIFDCDGTLTDSMPLHFLAWCDALRPWGISFPESRFHAMAGMPTDKIVEILSREQSIEVDGSQVAAIKEQRFFDRIDDLRPCADVCQVAESHDGRMPLAVASGGDRGSVTTQLKQIGIFSRFPVIVTAEDTQLHKPEPDVFLEAARRLDVESSKCLVFEDSDLGIEAAGRAGMDAIDVRNWSLSPSQPNSV